MAPTSSPALDALREFERRQSQAMPGPWERFGNEVRREQCTIKVADFQDALDAEFAAHARNTTAARLAIEEIERLTRENEQLRQQLERAKWRPDVGVGITE